MPRVSVFMASYQHQPFVAAAIHSVLAQTYQDFEIIVTDDGSTDGTAEIIAAIKDPRLTLRHLESNRGACYATNDALRQTRGEYVCIINSDDMYLPFKLEKQIAYLDAHPEIGAVFGYPVFMDEDSNVITDQSSTFNQNVFFVSNRSQIEWLRHFFFQGNCLCHPTMMIRRNCYEQLGLYDERLAQLPDFDMWIRLLSAYPIHILTEPLIGFRVLKNARNASAQKPEVIVRCEWENTLVRRHYAQLPPHLFAAVFSPELAALDISPNSNTDLALGRICMATDNTCLHRLGLELLYNALPAQATGPCLPQLAYKDYIQYTGKADIYNTLTKTRYHELENLLRKFASMQPS